MREPPSSFDGFASGTRKNALFRLEKSKIENGQHSLPTRFEFSVSFFHFGVSFVVSAAVGAGCRNVLHRLVFQHNEDEEDEFRLVATVERLPIGVLRADAGGAAALAWLLLSPASPRKIEKLHFFAWKNRKLGMDNIRKLKMFAPAADRFCMIAFPAATRVRRRPSPLGHRWVASRRFHKVLRPVCSLFGGCRCRALRQFVSVRRGRGAPAVSRY